MPAPQPHTQHPTNYPDVNALLAAILAGLQAVLGDKLVGLYLFGSLTTGSFVPGVSDIDLLAVTQDDIDAQDFQALDALHTRLLAAYPAWDNRLELLYLSRAALATFRTQISQIAVISPGEPFNIKDAGMDWLSNWYMVRTAGRTLYGPDPTTLIGPISQADFVQCIRDYVAYWQTEIDHVKTRRDQSYAILSLCRAYYTIRHGQQVSKQHAAAWAKEQFPQWADLIDQATTWRLDKAYHNADTAGTQPITKRFVTFMAEQINAL